VCVSCGPCQDMMLRQIIFGIMITCVKLGRAFPRIFCYYYIFVVLISKLAVIDALQLAPKSYCNKVSAKRNILVTKRSSLCMTRGLIKAGYPWNVPQSSRSDFIVRGVKSLFIVSLAVTSSCSIVPKKQPAVARGRATLEQAYERYSPRISAGGKFYANDLRELISKNDWVGIKAATSDPPQNRDRSDLTKVDGGVSERAAKAGGFSDARVLVACDLYAGSFSDNSISLKTKSMKEKVEKLRAIVTEMNLISRQALGEEQNGGLLFGIGAKVTPSPAELQKNIRQLYVEGGNIWNEYIFAANDGLPIQLAKLSYL
jgi:hypothetical protein